MSKKTAITLISLVVLIILIFVPIFTLNTVSHRQGNSGAEGYLECVPEHYSLYSLTVAYIKTPTIKTDYNDDPSETVSFGFWSCITEPDAVENTFLGIVK